MKRFRYLKFDHIWIFFILTIYMLYAFSFWPFTVDDAYISARYAQNAALGRGLTFNPGEKVMGYTNLLLVLLETLFYHFGWDGIFGAKVVGLLAGGGVLWMTVLLGKLIDPQESTLGGMLGATLLALFPFLPLSSVIGLESSLFTFLLLVAVVTFIHCWRYNVWSWQRQFALAILFVLATMTRPEGLGIALLLAAYQFLYTVYVNWRAPSWRESWKSNLSHNLVWFFEYCGLLLPVLLILTGYYGSPIPNTFWAKTAAEMVLLEKLVTGVAYLSVFFSESDFYLLIPLFLWPLFSGQFKGEYVIVMVISVFFTVYMLYTGGDWMPGFRFLLPVLPYYFVIAGSSLAKIWEILSPELSPLSSLSRRMVASIVVLAMVAPGFSGYLSLRDLVVERVEGYREAHYYVGNWLRDKATSKTVIALMDVGIIGFVSDCFVLDFGGLVSREVATFMHHDLGTFVSSPDTSAAIARWVLQQYPDYIVLAHNNPTPDPFVGWPHDQAIYNSESFQIGYDYLFTRRHAPGYFLSVYKLRDGR